MVYHEKTRGDVMKGTLAMVLGVIGIIISTVATIIWVTTMDGDYAMVYILEVVAIVLGGCGYLLATTAAKAGDVSKIRTLGQKASGVAIGWGFTGLALALAWSFIF
jgi:uncharacterized protein YceK